MTALVQNPAHELSSRVLRHGGACLRNAPGQGVYLNDESCDDHTNAFTAPALIGVKRKAGTSASEQFDTGNAVDINVLYRNRLDGRWREKKTLLHCWPPFVTGKSCQKKILRKHAAQHFARLNKISRNTIRDSVLALPSADRDRAVAVERNCSGPARPFRASLLAFKTLHANAPRLLAESPVCRASLLMTINLAWERSEMLDKCSKENVVSGSFISLKLMRFARWLAVLIAPWIEND